jgi:acyl-CoA synthetase (NDP forming)
MCSAMSFESLVAPVSVAVIGASPDRTKIRGVLLDQLKSGGYSGAIYPINPGYGEIDGLRCYPTIGAVQAPIDLAIVAIPTEHVLDVLTECADSGVRNTLVLTSGFAEQGGEHADRQADMAALAKRTGMRICGPNSVGFYSERAHLVATFSPAVETKPGRELPPPSRRRAGVVSQSGGMAFSFYDYGRPLGLGFSHIFNTGNEADLTLSDLFAFMVEDADTAVILLIIEGIRDPDRFLAAARAAAAARKPVIVCKIGRSQAGARAAASHTANMAGWDGAYDALFRTYGMIVASDPEEMTVIAAAFATAPPAAGPRCAIITVSGGTGALASDVLTAQGLAVPELGRSIQDGIAKVIPAYGSAQNPVDVTAQGAFEGGLSTALTLLATSDEVDQILVVGSLSSEKRVALDVDAIGRVVSAQAKPLLFYSYTRPSALACRTLAAAGVVPSIHLTWTAHAMRALMDFGRFVPRQEIAPSQKSRAEVLNLLGEGQQALSEVRASDVLAAFGIPGLPQRLAGSSGEARAAAEDIGWPVVLKIQSPDILHKSDVGGVRLGLADADAVAQAYADMLADVWQHEPDARIEGVLVQRMAPKGVEVIVGTVRDPVLGVVLMVGAGGTTTELHRDVTSRLAPVGPEEALVMLTELRSYPLLTGWRGAPPADLGALAKMIADVSLFAVSFAERVQEVELNPVLVHPNGQGCTIADALITTGARDVAGRTSADVRR